MRIQDSEKYKIDIRPEAWAEIKSWLSFKICVNSTEWHKSKLVQGVKPQLGLTP